MSKGYSGLFSGTSGDTSRYLEPPFADNLAKTAKTYKLTKSGYFGKKGKSSKSWIREIECANPYKESKKFFKKLTQGYKAEPLDNGHGVSVKFTDGTRVTFRPVTSSPKSPAVNIQITVTSGTAIKTQKIHFVKK